jgi:hypothetical protein
MKNSNGRITKAMASNIGVRISFTADEAEEFNKYVEEHSIHKGKFIRKLVLAAIREGKDDK